MYKRKEYIIIGAIISLTIFLGFMPMIISSCSNQKDEIIEEKEEKNLLSITIKGELNVKEVNITIPYGYSYGYIISKIKPYLNQYSIVEKELTKRYFDDTVLIVYSTDSNNLIEEDIKDGLLNINTATKEELTSLYGIGIKRADAIIEYRDKKLIESFSELKELLGVSDEIITSIKEKAIL